MIYRPENSLKSGACTSPCTALGVSPASAPGSEAERAHDIPPSECWLPSGSTAVSPIDRPA